MKGENIRDTATCPETGPWETGQRVFGEIEKSEGKRGLRKMIDNEFVFKERCICRSEHRKEAKGGARTMTVISARTRAGVGRTNSSSKAISVSPEEFL